MEQTTLQKIIEQKADQIRVAIEEAIDAGAKIEQTTSYVPSLKTCFIDGLYTQFNTENGRISVVLNFESEKIAKAFEPSLRELRARAAQKQEELRKLNRQIEELEANEPRNH